MMRRSSVTSDLFRCSTTCKYTQNPNIHFPPTGSRARRRCLRLPSILSPDAQPAPSRCLTGTGPSSNSSRSAGSQDHIQIYLRKLLFFPKLKDRCKIRLTLLNSFRHKDHKAASRLRKHFETLLAPGQDYDKINMN